MTSPRCRARASGQAAIEAVALVPVLILVAIAAWQLAAIGLAALRADGDLRREALTRSRPSVTRITDIRAVANVSTFLPGVSGLSVVAHGAVMSR